ESLRGLRIFKTAIANQLGVKPAIDAEVNLLEKDAIHPWVEAWAFLASVDRDLGSTGRESRKSQTPNPKSPSQKNPKSQSPKASAAIGLLEFGIFLEFGFWSLEFHQRSPPESRTRPIVLRSTHAAIAADRHLLELAPLG